MKRVNNSVMDATFSGEIAFIQEGPINLVPHNVLWSIFSNFNKNELEPSTLVCHLWNQQIKQIIDEPFNVIPAEVLWSIFSNFNKNELVPSTSVCQLWNQQINDYERRNDYLKTLKFAKQLAGILDSEKYKNEIDQLLSFKINDNFFESNDIAEIKSIFTSLDEDLLNILKNFDETTFEGLTEDFLFFTTDFFEIAKIFKRSDELIKEMNERKINKEMYEDLYYPAELNNICIDLILVNFFDKAITLLNAANDDGSALEEIGYQLTAEYPEKIIPFAKSLYDKKSQNILIKNVCVHLIIEGNFFLIEKIMKALPEINYNLFFDKILDELIEEGDQDKADKVLILMYMKL